MNIVISAPHLSPSSMCDCFSADQSHTHAARGNIVNVADTVPSAYLLHVLNNRKPGEMSSPIITSGLFFFPGLPISYSGGKLAPTSKAGMLNLDLISGRARAKN